MKVRILLAIMALALGTAMKSDKPAYQVFDLKGKKTDYSDIVKAALEADIVFFGELHTSPICHWLQLELTRDLYAEKKDRLILGAEMFETDNQLLLDEYVSGRIRERNFEEEARLWKNYKTDYKPLVTFALENKLRFIGTNVPRRYAALVNKNGFDVLDSLDAGAKKLIAPLPVKYDPELKGYLEIVEMMGGAEAAADHGSPYIAEAQALKDATMAHFILENYRPGDLFLHYNGTYHSNNFEGIVWYILQEKPDLRILTIASVEQDTITELQEENLGLANFTLCIPASMTKTN